MLRAAGVNTVVVVGFVVVVVVVVAKIMIIKVDGSDHLSIDHDTPAVLQRQLLSFLSLLSHWKPSRSLYPAPPSVRRILIQHLRRSIRFQHLTLSIRFRWLQANLPSKRHAETFGSALEFTQQSSKSPPPPPPPPRN